MKVDDDPNRVYQSVISILERNLKYLESVELNSTTAIAYKRIVRFLKRRSEKEIASMLGVQKQEKRPATNRSDPQLSDQEIEKLSGKDISAILASPTVTRKFLERLAAVRFGVSTGALSALRNRNALVDKLGILVEHENTHYAISRAVGKDKDMLK